MKTSKAVAVATPSTQAAVDFFVNDNLVTCGFGDIDNYRNRSKVLMCTTLRVGEDFVFLVFIEICFQIFVFLVPVAECATPPIAGTICTKNVDTKNACGSMGKFFVETNNNFSKFSGDFGAPAYTNSSGSLQVVGVVSFYPNSRPNARCQVSFFEHCGEFPFTYLRQISI